MKKPRRQIGLPDYRNVTRGSRLLADMIREAEERDKKKQSQKPKREREPGEEG
jgi:hypothetical protein